MESLRKRRVDMVIVWLHVCGQTGMLIMVWVGLVGVSWREKDCRDWGVPAFVSQVMLFLYV